jgi:hypothetical protein
MEQRPNTALENENFNFYSTTLRGTKNKDLFGEEELKQ